MSKAPAKAAVFTPEEEGQLDAWVKKYPYPIMGLVEALRSVQDWKRHVSPEAEEYLARIFKTTAARVHSVVTFFPYFTLEPTGRYRIGLCHGLSCQMAGSKRMAGCLKDTLGVAEKETTADGRFSWEEMECLGACEMAPALLMNEELQGQATEERVAALTKELK